MAASLLLSARAPWLTQPRFPYGPMVPNRTRDLCALGGPTRASATHLRLTLAWSGGPRRGEVDGESMVCKTIHAASGRARAASIKQILVRTVWQSSSPGPSRAPRHVHGVAFRRGGARSQIPVRQRPLLGHSTSIIVPRFAPCAKLRASCSSHHSYFARLLRGVLPSESQIAFPWRASPFPAILRESGFAGSDARSPPATLVFPTPTFLDMAFACLGQQAGFVPRPSLHLAFTRRLRLEYATCYFPPCLHILNQALSTIRGRCPAERQLLECLQGSMWQHQRCMRARRLSPRGETRRIPNRVVRCADAACSA